MGVLGKQFILSRKQHGKRSKGQVKVTMAAWKSRRFNESSPLLLPSMAIVAAGILLYS